MEDIQAVSGATFFYVIFDQLGILVPRNVPISGRLRNSRKSTEIPEVYYSYLSLSLSPSISIEIDPGLPAQDVHFE